MSSRVFVGNLSYTASQEELERSFQDNGFDVRGATIVTDRDTGNARGFAFVELGSDDDAARAIEVMNGVSVAGRGIRVSEAHERERRPASNGQGAGHQGGRRREEKDRRW